MEGPPGVGGPSSRLAGDRAYGVFLLTKTSLLLRMSSGRSQDIRNPEGFERLLHRSVDMGEALPLDLLENVRAVVAPRRQRYMDAALDRAIAVTRRDAAGLRRVLETYEAMGARPLIARVHCDLGRLTGDDREMEAGIAILRELGDELSLERVEE